jgi:heme exporter protein C
MGWAWFHRFGSPPHLYRLAGTLTPWFAWPAAILIVGALYLGLFVAPPDYQQGDGFRIIYVHAPSAWLAVMIYAVMAIAAGVGLIWRMKVAHAVAVSCAGVGAWFTAVSLVTAQLVLLFLFLGYMGLRSGIEDLGRADRASAVLALVGVINLPIIRYSVEWWNSIHQAPSVMKMDQPSMPMEMLAPLLMMLLGFSLYFGAVLLVRVRAEILRRERSAAWIREVLS